MPPPVRCYKHRLVYSSSRFDCPACEAEARGKVFEPLNEKFSRWWNKLLERFGPTDHPGGADK